MHKKEKMDARRGKMFTKIGKEISVIVKESGADPASNSRLRDAIAKAKANNVPNDNIERIVKKAAGEAAGLNYESITYEGYGPRGVALIVETLTDNRNRTAGDLRHYFDKFGGNLGQPGSVSFLFERKGVIILEHSEGVSEETLMELAIDSGAEDFVSSEAYEIYTSPEQFTAVREALEKNGYDLLNAEIEMVPGTYIKLTDPEDIKNMEKLIGALEDNDDVQNIWHNCEDV